MDFDLALGKRRYSSKLREFFEIFKKKFFIPKNAKLENVLFRFIIDVEAHYLFKK